MFLTLLILGLTVLSTFLNPKLITEMTNYKSKKIIINIWNIYAFTIFLIILTRKIRFSMIMCALISIIYNIYLYFNNMINKSFVKVSIPLNMVVIFDMLFLSK